MIVARCFKCCEFLEMCIDFGAVQVVYFESSDKHEPSLTLSSDCNLVYVVVKLPRETGVPL